MRIPFTKYEFNFRKSDSSVIEVNRDVFENLASTDSKFKGERPQLDPKQRLGDDIVIIPYTPLPMDIVYNAAKYSDVLRTIHQHIRKEIFRQDYEIVELFAHKCKDCEKEYDNPVDECDECGSRNLREPDVEQKKLLVKFCKEVNDNSQDIINVSEELNDDLEIIDNAYMLMIKDYLWNNDGDLLGSIPVETIRADPRFMHIVADERGRPGRNRNGDLLYFCAEHRDTLQENKKRCPQCNKETFPANYRSMAPNGEYIYYSKDEVKHLSKYNPSLTYGFSNLYAVWMKVVTLMNQDNYIKDYYAKQRPPRGLLFLNTPNADSMEKSWAWMLDEWKKNPHQISPICVEQTAGTKGNLVNFIDFMRPLDEMQYTETRNEMRRQIGAPFGIMPLYQGDMSTGGGLNNEGLQITITNRAMTDGQGIYNEGFYPWLCRQMGVTDYKIFLPPNEEEDLMHFEELKAKKIDNAVKMQSMGFDVIFNEDEEFEYDPLDEPVEKPEQSFGFPGSGDSSSDGTPKPDESKTSPTGTPRPVSQLAEEPKPADIEPSESTLR